MSASFKRFIVSLREREREGKEAGIMFGCCAGVGCWRNLIARARYISNNASARFRSPRHIYSYHAPFDCSFRMSANVVLISRFPLYSPRSYRVDNILQTVSRTDANVYSVTVRAYNEK